MVRSAHATCDLPINAVIIYPGVSSLWGMDDSMTTATTVRLWNNGNIMMETVHYIRVHSVLEKSLKNLEFGVKTSRPLKVLENR